MSFDRSLTRGPLAASVYWRRRAAVFGVLLLLLVGMIRLFGGGGADDAAAVNGAVRPAASAPLVVPVVPENVGAPSAGATPTTPATPTPSTPAVGPTAAASPATTLPQATTALPTPTGRCSDDDVSVAAAIPRAEATRTVAINLTIKTNVAAACLWQFGPRTVQVEITSGKDQIWSTVDCPKAVATRTLTLRRDTPVQVPVAWNSRRSDSSCSTRTQWALPGYYHAQVAALGGEPSDVPFQLRKPVSVPKAPATPKVTTAPKVTATKGPRSEPTGTPVNPD